MTFRVVLRPEARDDLIAARDWYERQRSGLGQSFTEAVRQLLANVADNPALYEKAHGDVRRARVRRFPYVVYYRVLTDRIEVLGVFHGSRNPNAWRSRT